MRPFVTEDIYEHIPGVDGSIATADYPTVQDEFVDEQASAGMSTLIELIQVVRQIRADVNRPMSEAIDMLIRPATEAAETFLTENASFIHRFCHPGELVIDVAVKAPDEAKSAVVTDAELFLPLEGLLNFEEEIDRLEKELQKWQSELDRVSKKLSNEKFVANAPEAIVQEERNKGEHYQQMYDKAEKQLDRMRELAGDTSD